MKDLWPPPYRYGSFWSVLAAQIAFCTFGGASAGAAAVPSASSTARAPGTSGFGCPRGTVLRAGVGGGGGGEGAPPVPGTANAPTGATTQNSMEKTARQKPRTAVRTIEKLLFRRPTGLADGLALKELAPQVAQDLTRPTQLGPPLPEHDFGHSALLARHCIPPCRVMSNP